LIQSEVEITRSDNTSSFIILQTLMSYNEESKSIILHNTAHSIDSLKQERDQRMDAELKANQAQAAEEAAFRAVAMTAHELRNCTQGIAMTAETMMNEATPTHELRRLAVTVNRQLQHLRHALNGAIKLSTLVSNANRTVSLESVSVCQIIIATVQGLADYATATGVSLTATEEALTCNHIFALTNEESVCSGLNNLIANAVRFTPEGGTITVGVDIVDEPDSSVVRIIVTDTGSGIPESLHSKLLETTTGATGTYTVVYSFASSLPTFAYD
jgi:signal transduction histidine kinase